MVEKSMTSGWWPNLMEPFRHLGERVADWFAPRSEALAAEDAYEIRIELPGVKAEDVDVQIHDGTVSVQGEKRAARKEEGKSFFFSEVEYGSFQRSFRVPADADQESVDASFADGVLTIRVPRRVEANATAKKIAVKRG